MTGHRSTRQSRYARLLRILRHSWHLSARSIAGTTSNLCTLLSPSASRLRLAIDATLLVQRLHFADDPHASRHVIGFYRLVTSLRQHGVVPLMVFDHPQKRLALKDREQIKRRHKRELDRIRSKLEHERRGRLLELQAHLDALSDLQESDRRQVGELLDRWRTPSPPEVAEDGSQSSTSADPTIPRSAVTPPPPTATSSKPESVAYSMHANWMQLEESLRSAASSQSKGQKVLAEAEKQIYQTIAIQLKSGEAPQPLPPPSDGVEDPIDAATETAPSHPLTSLNAMHYSLTKTYDRATSPLSASIYKDCAELCSLMAVRCSGRAMERAQAEGGFTSGSVCRITRALWLC